MKIVEQKTDTAKKRFRYIFLVVLVLNIIAASLFPPVQPHVQLPAENVSHDPLFGNFYLTNTLIATLLADVIIILIAISIRRQVKAGKTVLTGVGGMFAAILEGLYSMTESTAGKFAKKIFPYFATIFLLVLVVNWMELIPGVDSIGIIHESDHGVPIREIIPGFLTTLVRPDETAVEEEHAEVVAEAHADETDAHAEDGDSGGGHGYGLIPFVRVASTDLNFTMALALSSVVMTQVVGIQALGAGYFKKYWNTSSLGRSWKEVRFGNPLDFIKGFIDVIVGILEIVAEIAKIISFSFRLFGNIFAGSVMLFVLGTLVPVFIQFGLLGLEMFVGLIQAFVFGMLTMVFMSGATVSHDDHGDEHAH
jgi:F-type H+-transporting ATPase subunit a